jgi:hypothetical protein
MPVLLAGWKPDDVTGPNLLNKAALALRPTATAGDNERLTERMLVPRGARASSNVTLAPDARAGAFA